MGFDPKKSALGGPPTGLPFGGTELGLETQSELSHNPRVVGRRIGGCRIESAGKGTQGGSRVDLVRVLYG